MTKAMATAWAKDNIQVNAVLPGWIDTDLTKRAREQVQGLHDRRGRAHAGRTLGHAGGPRRHRRVPGERRLGLRHRDGDPGRRRLLRAGRLTPRGHPRDPDPGGAL